MLTSVWIVWSLRGRPWEVNAMMHWAGMELWRATEALKSSSLQASGVSQGGRSSSTGKGGGHTTETEQYLSPGAGPYGRSTPASPFPYISSVRGVVQRGSPDVSLVNQTEAAPLVTKRSCQEDVSQIYIGRQRATDAKLRSKRRYTCSQG